MSVQKAERQCSQEPQVGSLRNAKENICTPWQGVLERSLAEGIQGRGSSSRAVPGGTAVLGGHRTSTASAMGCALATAISQTSWHCIELKNLKN